MNLYELIRNNPEYINKLTPEYLTDEIIDLAIKNGYRLSENSSKNIKSNSKFIKKIIDNRNYQDIIFADDSLFEKYFEIIIDQMGFDEFLGLFSTKKDSESLEKKILSSKNALKYLIKNNAIDRVSDLDLDKKFIDDEFIEFCLEHKVVDIVDLVSPNKLTEILEKYKKLEGYILSEKSPDILKNNEMCVKASIERYPYTLDYANPLALSKEMIEYAILNGYTLSSTSPEIIKKNPEYVRLFIEKDPYTFNFADPTIINKELIEYAMSKGFRLSQFSPDILKKNEMCVKASIERYPYTLDYANPLALSKEMIEYAILNGYTLSSTSPEIIKKSPEYIRLFIEKEPYEIDWANPEIITEEMAEYVLSKGYTLSSRSPEIIKNNLKYLMLCINNSPYSIDYVDSSVITKGIVEYAISKGYTLSPRSPQILRENLEYIKLFIKNNPYSINAVNPSIINKELVEYAISKGYHLTEISPEIIKNNAEYVRLCIANNSNSLNYVGPSIINKEMVEYAISKGFNLSANSPEIINNNAEYVRLCIANNSNSLNYAGSSVITKEMIEYAISKGYKISLNSNNNILRCTEYFEPLLDDVIKDKSIDYQKSLRKMYEVQPALIGHIYLHIKDYFSEELLSVFGSVSTLKMYKYIELSGSKCNLLPLIQSGKISEMKYLYDFLTEKIYVNNQEEFNVLFFRKFVEKFLKYDNLNQDIFKKIHTLNNDDIESIRKLYLSNMDLDINTLEELRNINDIMFIKNKENITELKNINEIKNIIFLMLCNKKIEDIEYTLSSIINTNKISDLSKKLNENDNEILEQLSCIIDLLEYIMNLNDLDKLKSIANTINEKNHKSVNDNVLSEFNQKFVDIESTAKYLYGQELKDSLTNISKLETTKVYESTEYLLENGEKVIKKTVEMKENTEDYKVLVHAMNAYGSGSKITDWNNPRIVGKTYLCLSLSSSDVGFVPRDTTSINNVALAFDTIEASSLVLMGEHDIYSKGDWNDLSITSRDCNFDISSSILKATPNNTYNEYVLFRENSSGEYLKPSAVIVRNEEPTQDEINAAAYLNIPLLKLNKVKKISDEETKNLKQEKKQETILEKKEEYKKIKEYLTSLKLYKDKREIEDEDPSFGLSKKGYAIINYTLYILLIMFLSLIILYCVIL